ncbi:MAG TPA: ATP-binding protein [Mycobacteriales bacterium]|nr:ATP-binding protein [Mycobacteriales bacterium]
MARALVQHAAVSLAALILVAAAAATVCVRLVESEALRQAESGGEEIATRLVAPLINDAFNNGDPAAFQALDTRVKARMSDDTIQRIKVWSADGTIIYCDDHEQMGLRFPLEADDRAVLVAGGVDSDISDLAKSENVYDRGFGESLEVYAGVRDSRGRPILVETYFTARRLHTDEAALTSRIVPVVLVAVLVLGLLLVPLAFGLARRVADYERERQAMIRLAVEASSAERRRVAGELHDGVIQDLAGVGYALSAVDSQLVALGGTFSDAQIGELRGRLQTAQRLVVDDAVSLREVAGVEYAIDRGAADPAAALQKIAADLRTDGMKVEVAIETLPPLPAAARAALIRVGREALRNAAKHAPGAAVALDLGVEGGRVVLAVTDEGPGFDPAAVPGPVDGHIGLALLADAAEAAGGRLELRSRPGKGTTVRMSLPLPEPVS